MKLQTIYLTMACEQYTEIRLKAETFMTVFFDTKFIKANIRTRTALFMIIFNLSLENHQLAKHYGNKRMK